MGNLQRVRQAISTARRVLENSKHTLLAGYEATRFAFEMVCRPLLTCTFYATYQRVQRNLACACRASPPAISARPRQLRPSKHGALHPALSCTVFRPNAAERDCKRCTGTHACHHMLLARTHRKDGSCQPNFRRSVAPDPAAHCGPYAPVADMGAAVAQPLAPAAALPAAAGTAPQAQAAAAQPGAPATQALPQGQLGTLGGLRRRMHASEGGGRAGPHGLGERSHDTIAMVVVDASGRFAAGASTNGMTHKARLCAVTSDSV